MNTRQRNEKNRQSLVRRLQTASSDVKDYTLSNKFGYLAKLLMEQGASDSEEITNIDRTIEKMLNLINKDIASKNFSQAAIKLGKVEEKVAERASYTNAANSVEEKESFFAKLAAWFLGKKKEEELDEESLFGVKVIFDGMMQQLTDELEAVEKELAGYMKKYAETKQMQWKFRWNEANLRKKGYEKDLDYVGACFGKQGLIERIATDRELVERMKSLQPSPENFKYMMSQLKEIDAEIYGEIEEVDIAMGEYMGSGNSKNNVNGEFDKEFEEAYSGYVGGNTAETTGSDFDKAYSVYTNAGQQPVAATGGSDALEDAMKQVDEVVAALEKQTKDIERSRARATMELEDIAQEYKTRLKEYEMAEKNDPTRANHVINPELNTIRQKYTSKLYEVQRYEQALRDANNKLGIARRIQAERNIQEFNELGAAFFENLDELALAMDDRHKAANEKTEELDRAVGLMDSTKPASGLEYSAGMNAENSDATEYELGKRLLGLS